jgi:hypothetical protein
VLGVDPSLLAFLPSSRPFDVASLQCIWYAATLVQL